MKNRLKFSVKDRDIVYDWYNTYFQVEYQLQKLVDGLAIGANVNTAPFNSSFSLIKDLTVNSAGKTIFRTIMPKPLLKTSFGILTKATRM